MSTTLYAGSNDLEEVAWCGANSGGKTHQVKMRKPNALGLYDMSGNVAEWCWDIKHTVTAETPLRSDAYDSQRFYCGGSWNTDENAVVAARSHTTAAYRPNERGWGAVGFRVARSKK